MKSSKQTKQATRQATYEEYVCEFWENKRSETEIRTVSIYDAIEMLALKEGADVVEYEDGNIGIVGYYIKP